MDNRTVRILTVICICILLLSGCGRSGDNMSGYAVQDGDGGGISIVTSFYPVYIAAINVTRDVPGVTVKNMTKPQTGCLHDYSLKPEDLKILEKADVFIINGAGMEAFLEDVIKQQKDLDIIEASEGIQLLKDENGEDNPHVWVSVTNAIAYTGNIASRLSAINGDNAQKYSANAAAYIQKLEELRADMHSELDGLKNRDIITFHEAFPYFAQEFNLNIAAVIEREPGSEPTPKELGEIIDMIKQTGIKALFAEPQYSSKAADTIARETGAKVYALDPVVTGEADANSYDAYIEVMRQNKKILKEALE